MSLIIFNKEQKLIQGEIRKFATTEIEPEADNIEKNAVFPIEIIKKLSELGVLGLIIPEKYGGPEMDTTSFCIAIEEISKVCASIGFIITVNNCLVAYPLMKFANESIKKKYLTKLAGGEIGGFIPMPEFEFSKESFKIKITNDSFIISGERDFVLNGEGAEFFIIPVKNSNNVLFLIFPKANEVNSKRSNIMGIRSSGISNFEFDEFKLKKESCFINENEKKKVYQEIINYADLGFSAGSVGLAQVALVDSINYAKERKQFKRYICEFDMVKEMIADMKIKIDTARFLLYDAAARVDKNQDYSLAAKITRQYCGEIAVSCILNAIQIHGGYGYTKDYPIERYLRDAKVLQVVATEPLSLKNDIARELLK